MKQQVRATRLLFWFSFLIFVAPGFTGQSRAPRDSKETRDFKIFASRVQAYVRMQHGLEASLSTLKPTNDAARIVAHQHALAGKIADARHDARPGGIFTHAVIARIRIIIRDEFRGPDGRQARRTIRQDDASKVIAHLHVNDEFPDGVPLTTTPPDLLIKLPELPQELAYRFIGRDLTLIDTKARLIVDIIPNAIP